MSFCFLFYFLIFQVRTQLVLFRGTTTHMHRKAKMHEIIQKNSGPVSHGSHHSSLILSENLLNIQ